MKSRQRVEERRRLLSSAPAYDTVQVSQHHDACLHETGYPSHILRQVFEAYSVDIFEDDYPIPSGYGRATQNEVYFFLVYKFIHVRRVAHPTTTPLSAHPTPTTSSTQR